MILLFKLWRNFIKYFYLSLLIELKHLIINIKYNNEYKNRIINIVPKANLKEILIKSNYQIQFPIPKINLRRENTSHYHNINTDNQ